MQQEKYQHPILNLESGGQVLVSTRPPQRQPTAQKTSLFFGGSLLLLVGAVGGLVIGNNFAERRIVDAQNALKLEQLQRAATKRQIQKFCTESLGANYGG